MECDMKRPLKILLLGDYSNCHRALADGLRSLGCNVTQASAGSSWMNCDRQIDISRSPNKIGGLKLAYRMRYGDLNKIFRGFDVVAIHDLNFVQLRPERLFTLFNRLKRFNSSIFLTSMSTDIAFLDMLEAQDSPLRYSEWFIDHKPSRMYLANPKKWDEWHAVSIVNYQRHALANIDGAVSVLYEYHMGMQRALGSEKAVYGGIPIDTDRLQPVNLDGKIDKVKLFLGRDRYRKLMKGSDLLEIAARRVVERYPEKAELVIVENRPYAEFVELLKDSHVVLDQIYSYTPATTALMAMSYGLNVVSGAEPEYYDFIKEYDNRPIINAPMDCDALTDCIENIVLHPDEIAERGRRSRAFVVKHNNAKVVAERFMNFWTSRLELKYGTDS